VDESLLNRVQMSIPGKSLYCINPRPVGTRRRNQAAHHSHTIQENFACTALAFRAAFFRTYQSSVLAQQA
jgi:hypothetical protein